MGCTSFWGLEDQKLGILCVVSAERGSCIGPASKDLNFAQEQSVQHPRTI